MDRPKQMQELVVLEETLLAHKGSLPPDDLLTQAKQDGFADRYLAQILAIPEKDVRARRTEIGVVEGWHPVAVSGVEDSAYYYSTYNAPDVVDATDNPRKAACLTALRQVLSKDHAPRFRRMRWLRGPSIRRSSLR